jgi:hypothetical protein
MQNVARSFLLVIMAMSLGLALGAVTKFGFGYDISLRAETIAGAP